MIGLLRPADALAEEQALDAVADTTLVRARTADRDSAAVRVFGACKERSEVVDEAGRWLQEGVQADSVLSIMSTKKPIILIADDDPEILTLLGIRLSKKGFQILEAQDGNAAIDKARKEHPDLVLLDVMMPGKNGWEVAKALREDPELRDIGIVMLTAIGERVNEMTSPLYGADDFVDKPFDFADLEKKIRAVLDRRAAR